jgi:acid phosphatase type 7
MAQRGWVRIIKQGGSPAGHPLGRGVWGGAAEDAAAGAGRLVPTFLVGLLATLLALGCASEPASSPNWTPPPAEVAGSPVVVAAGDIAHCRSEGDEATAGLLEGIDATIITLGDNAYRNGSARDYQECYEPTWGRFKDRTRPAPGNHEYDTEGASAYFRYFGKAAGHPEEGYYSYDLGAWHLVALNSNCEEVAGGCDASSPQVRWLRAELANDGRSCTLAYLHHPLFTSGKYRPGIPEGKPLWEALYAAGADVVLSGHDHNYQRFAPQDPEGRADPRRGIRQFVVGTGGRNLYPISWFPLANIEAHDDETYGVLKLTLSPKGYQWRFLAVGGGFTDSGGARCH